MQALQSNASKVNTLHLSNITLEDAGEYICMAESTHTGQTVQAMQSAWLEVLPGETHLSSHQHLGISHKFVCHSDVISQTASSKEKPSEPSDYHSVTSIRPCDHSFIIQYLTVFFPSTGTIISRTVDLTAAEIPPGNFIHMVEKKRTCEHLFLIHYESRMIPVESQNVLVAILSIS